jgi:hypothetical protein
LLAQLNRDTAEYARQLQAINALEQERVTRARQQVQLQGEAEERRIIIELLQAEGDSAAALEQVEAANHAERMRRIAELDSLGYSGAENLMRLENLRHEATLDHIREQEAERQRVEEQRLQQEREAEQAARDRAAIEGRSLEADILALQGEEEAARRLRIQLDLEREILRVKQDQTLTDEERARTLDLLQQRAELQLAQSPGGDRSPEFRTLQGGFVGAQRLAGRAFGAESPEQRLAREAQRQRDQALTKLTDILREIEGISRDGVPAILN